jgi:hypothetical protein
MARGESASDSSDTLDGESSDAPDLPESSEGEKSEKASSSEDETDDDDSSDKTSSDDDDDDDSDSSDKTSGTTSDSSSEMEVEEGKGTGGAAAGGGAGLSSKVAGVPIFAWLAVAGALTLIAFILASVLSAPQTVTCTDDDEGHYVVLLEQAEFDRADPPMICSHYFDREVVVYGDEFLSYNDELFTVELDGKVLEGQPDRRDECDAPSVRRNNAELCREFGLTVPRDAVRNESYRPTIRVVAPESTDEECSEETSEILVKVPAPTVADVFPPAVCRNQFHTVTITGRYFLTVGGVQPHVHHAGNRSAADPANDRFGIPFDPQHTNTTGCMSLAVPGLAVENCSTITVDVSAANLTGVPFIDLNHVEVINPAPAGCVGKEALPNQIRLVDEPVITASVPPVACVRQAARNVSVTGTGFLEIDGFFPRVNLDNTQLVVHDMRGCQNLNVTRHTLRVCTELVVEIPRDFRQVTAPTPFRFDVFFHFIPQCTHFQDNSIVLLPEPDVADLSPRVFCADANDTMTLVGDHFYTFNGAKPLLRVNGGAEFPQNRVTMGGCSQVPLIGSDVLQTCTTMVVDVRTSDSAGWNTIAPNDFTVQNPDPVDCMDVSSANATNFWTLGDANTHHITPSVSGATPYAVCTHFGTTTVDLTGTFVRLRGVHEPAVYMSGWGGAEQQLSSSLLAFSCSSRLPVPHVEVCTSLRVTIPQITNVTNPLRVTLRVDQSDRLTSQTGCDHTFAEFSLLPPPRVEKMYPRALCHGAASFAIFEGTDFYIVNGHMPTVTMNGVSILSVQNETACTVVSEVSAQPVMRCQALRATITDGQAAQFPSDGVAEVVITNPSPIDCNSAASAYPVVFYSFAAATMTSASPSFLCVDTANTNVTVSGSNFAVVHNADDPAGAMLSPTVTVDGVAASLYPMGCTTVLNTTVSGRSDVWVESCSSFVVDVPRSAMVSQAVPRALSLAVTQPTGMTNCSVTDTVVLSAIPPMSVTSVPSPAFCAQNSTQRVTMLGEGFLRQGASTLPALSVPGFTAGNFTLLNCTTLPGNAGAVDGWELCRQAEFLVDIVSLNQGSIWLNGSLDGATDCDATFGISMRFIPPVSIASATPTYVCSAATPVVTLTGVFAIVTGGPTPLIELPDGARVTQTTLSNLAQSLPEYQVYNTLTFTLPDNNYLGDISLTVYTTCSDTISGVLYGLATPALASVVASEVCELDPYSLQINAANLETVEGSPPTVWMNTIQFPSGGVSCSPVGGPFSGRVAACSAVNVSLAPRELVPGFADVRVANYNTSCLDSNATLLEVFPDPVIANMTPDRVCVDQNYTFTINGSAFHPRLALYFDHEGGQVFPKSFRYISSTQLEVDIVAFEFPVGFFDLRIVNLAGSSCLDVQARALHVHPVVLPFFLDPPSVYNQIQISVTLYTTGLLASADEISLVRSGETSVVYVLKNGKKDDDSITNYTFQDNGRYNRPKFIIPTGLAAGLWSVTVKSEIGCAGLASDVLFVQDTARIDVDSLTPSHAWTGEDTAIEIARNSSDADPFVSTPRIYISPESDTGGTVGVALRAVNFVNQNLLTAVVPKGTAVDDYKVIVINPSPNNNVGVFEAPSGFLRVMAKPGPLIADVSPFQFLSAPITATITGENFDNSSVSIQLTCRDAILPYGTKFVVEVPEGQISTLTSTEITFTVSVGGTYASPVAGQVPQGSDANSDMSVCFVTVVNNNTKATDSWASITYRKTPNPVYGFRLTEKLPAARRVPAVVDTPVTRRSKFLTAIGGDDGTIANAFDTAVSATVELDGTLGAFQEQRTRLPAARSFGSSVRLGQYLYFVGGCNSGDNATSTVWRSQLLSPLQTPTMDVSIALLRNGSVPLRTNVTAGIWFYRVSAVFDGTHPDNANGESLPGEILTLQLPSLANQNMELTLTWDRIPGASGYRVYRTPSAGLSALQVELYASTLGENATAYVERGYGTLNPSATPFPVGSFGAWNVVHTLNTARCGHGVALAPDPADATRHHIFAIGGSSTSTTAAASGIATYESFTVQVTPPAADSLESERHTIVSSGQWDLPSGLNHIRVLVLNSFIVSQSLSGRETILMVFPSLGESNYAVGVVLSTGNATFVERSYGSAVGRNYPCHAFVRDGDDVVTMLLGGAETAAPGPTVNNQMGVLGLADSAASPWVVGNVVQTRSGADLTTTLTQNKEYDPNSAPGKKGAYGGCGVENGVTFMVGGYEQGVAGISDEIFGYFN